jgi:hypothetical protein
METIRSHPPLRAIPEPKKNRPREGDAERFVDPAAGDDTAPGSESTDAGAIPAGADPLLAGIGGRRAAGDAVDRIVAG